MKRLSFLLPVFAALILSGCGSSPKEVVLIPESNFEKEIDGKEVKLFTIKSPDGMVVQLTNYGARIVSLWVPDKDGNMVDVVLGRNTIDEYLSSDELYYGATVGRYANRIANGRFELDGKEYQLDVNDGRNHLHGGSKGLFNVIWNAEPYLTVKYEEAVIFKYHSPAGEMGYPGNVDITVRMIACEGNELRIYYEATTDEPTVINLSNHAYFNLNGEGSGSIEDHMLKIYGEYFTPTDDTLIPTGEIRSVRGTPLDFNDFHRIGDRINDDYEQLKLGGGYDHNWITNNYNLSAEVFSEKTGIAMGVFSSAPGIQFYSGNFIKGIDVGKSGKIYDYRSAFCLETQHFPDSPNHPEFPTTVLLPGQKYSSTCYYFFGIVDK